jgi:hypothetical protein
MVLGLVMLLLAFALVVMGCPTDVDDDDGRPNIDGRITLILYRSKNAAIAAPYEISKGKGYYCRGSFMSVWAGADDCYFVFKASEPIVIKIDLMENKLGRARIQKNSESLNVPEKGNTVSLEENDTLLFYITSTYFSTSPGPHWEFSFLVQ